MSQPGEAHRTSAERMHRKGTAVKSRGRETLQGVLKAAHQVLVEEGASGFSVRKVANRAEIALGNLSYYYPTRGDLLHELFRRTVRAYDAHLHERLDEISDPRKRLETLARIWVDGITRPEIAIQLWELWALSAHDARVAEAFDEVYEHFLQTMERVIGECRPDLSPSRVTTLAALASALVDGGSLFVGAGRRRLRSFGRLPNEIVGRIVALVMAEPRR